MSALAQRFIETEDGNQIRLHAVSSVSQFPYHHYVGFEFPLELDCRAEDIETVHSILRHIGVKPKHRLCVEETGGLSLYFQNPGDLLHFRLANEMDDYEFEGIVEQSFGLLDRTSRDKKPLIRVRNHFEKARQKAGVFRDRFDSRIDNHRGVVDVQTASVEEQLSIWRHLPQRTKSRLILAG